MARTPLFASLRRILTLADRAARTGHDPGELAASRPSRRVGGQGRLAAPAHGGEE